MILATIAAAAALAASPPPSAIATGFFDGAALVATCVANDQIAGAKQSVCYGYIAGAADMILMQQAMSPLDQRTVCPPATTKLDAIVSAILARGSWATNARAIGAASFVKAALEDAYPCRRDRDVM